MKETTRKGKERKGKERKGKERKQTVVWENDGEFAQALKIFKKYCPRKKSANKSERKKEGERENLPNSE